MAKGFIDFSGLDPRNGDTATFRLPRTVVDQIARYAPANKLADLHCVREIVESPQRAFRGLRTVDESFGDRRIFVEVPQPDGLCLTGIPATRIVNSRKEAPPRGFTFAVFVDKGLVVFD